MIRNLIVTENDSTKSSYTGNNWSNIDILKKPDDVVGEETIVSSAYSFNLGMTVGITTSGIIAYFQDNQEPYKRWYKSQTTFLTGKSIVYASGMFIIVGTGGKLIISTDGLTWNAMDNNLSNVVNNEDMYDITFNNTLNKFVTIGNNGRCATSSNGIYWEVSNFIDFKFTNGQASSITFGNGVYVAVGYDDITGSARCSYSTDCINWNGLTTLGYIFKDKNINKVVFENNMFIAGGESIIAYSLDGINWIKSNGNISTPISSIVYANNLYYAFSSISSGSIYTSNDGISWSTAGNRNISINAAIVNNNVIYLACSNGEVHSSTDGITWTIKSVMASSDDFYNIIFANNIYIVVGSSGKCYTSSNGNTWTVNTSLRTIVGTTSTSIIKSIAYGNSIFVASAYGDIYATSSDGITWTTSTKPKDLFNDISNISYATITFVNNRFLLSSSRNKHLYSLDGFNWLKMYKFASLTNSPTAVITNTPIYGAYGNNIAIKIKDGICFTTTDYETWFQNTNFEQLFGTSLVINNVSFINGMFFVLTTNGKCITSTDGITWSNSTSASAIFGSAGITSIAYGNNTYIMLGDDSLCAISTDGINWVSNSDYLAKTISAVKTLGLFFTNNSFISYVYVGGTYKYLTSTNGSIWTITAISLANNVTFTKSYMCCKDGKYLFVTQNALYYSTDGSNWSLSTNFTILNNNSVINMCPRDYGFGFILINMAGNVLTSTDGNNWEIKTEIDNTLLKDSLSNETIYDIIVGPNKFIAIGKNNIFNGSRLSGGYIRFLKSYITYGKTTVDYIYSNVKTICGINNLIAITNDGRIQVSDDGISWYYMSNLRLNSSTTIDKRVKNNLIIDGSKNIYISLDNCRSFKKLDTSSIPSLSINDIKLIEYSGGALYDKILVVGTDSNNIAKLYFSDLNNYITTFSPIDNFNIDSTKNIYFTTGDNISGGYKNYITGEFGEFGEIYTNNDSNIFTYNPYLSFAKVSFLGKDVLNIINYDNTNVVLGKYGRLVYIDKTFTKYVYDQEFNDIIGDIPFINIYKGLGNDLYGFGNKFNTYDYGILVRSNFNIDNFNDNMYNDSYHYNSRIGVPNWLTLEEFSYKNTSIGITTKINDMTYGNGIYITATNTCLTSSIDGITWCKIPNMPNTIYKSIRYGNGKFVAITSSSANYYSTDGITWTTGNLSLTLTTPSSKLIFENSTFMVVGASGKLATSSDGITWTLNTGFTTAFGSSLTVNNIALINGIYIAIGNSGKLITSSDGLTWNSQAGFTSIFGSINAYSLTYGNGRYFIVGANGVCASSTDTVNWTLETGLTTIFGTNIINSILYNGTKFIACGDNGICATSTDGNTWITNTTFTSKFGNNNIVYGTSYLNGVVFAYGSNASLVKSTSLTSWTFIEKIGYANTAFLGVPKKYLAYNFTPRINNEGVGELIVGTKGQCSRKSTNYLLADNHGMIDTWIKIPEFTTAFGSTNDVLSIATNGMSTIAVGTNGRAVYSTDLLNWTVVSSLGTIFTGLDINDISYGKGYFIAVGTSGTFAYSSDGINWTKGTININPDNIIVNETLNKVVYDDILGIFIIVGNSSRILKLAINGLIWVSIVNNNFGTTNNHIYDINVSTDTYMIGGTAGNLAISV